MDLHTSQGNKGLFYFRKITGAVLCIALGLVFIYSAYTKSGILIYFHNFSVKLYDNGTAFDNFQWAFLNIGFDSIFLTGVIARLMIGLELLLGLFLVFHIFLKSFTYRAVTAMLLFFIFYLLMAIVKQGNNGNCGCFGDEISMTPLAAIIKNLVLIAVTVLLMFIYPIKPYKYQEFVCLFIGLVAFSLPFVVNNMYTETGPKICKARINMDALYHYDSIPKVELRQGKHIVAFMSLSCPHCRKAAHLLTIIKNQHPDLPVYFILIGPKQMLDGFFKETGALGMPYLFFDSLTDFSEMIDAGADPGSRSGVPAIYWINNNIIEFKSTYYQLDPNVMENWLHATKPGSLK